MSDQNIQLDKKNLSIISQVSKEPIFPTFSRRRRKGPPSPAGSLSAVSSTATSKQRSQAKPIKTPMALEPTSWTRWMWTKIYGISTMWGPRSIAKLVNISPITMVYGTQITIVTGA